MRALAVGVALLAAGGAPAHAAKLTIRSTPALNPAYSAGVSDYTVRCKAGTPVTVKATIPKGRTVAVDGSPPSTGNLTREVSLEPGQAFTFSVDGSAARNVRCVPSDLTTWRVQRRSKPVAQWLVFSPTLTQFHATIGPYSVIADRHGVPVWWKRSVGAVPLDARVLPDGTFTWARLGGPFAQTYWDHVALDGTELRPFTTVGVGADHHDMQVLPNGDVLMLAYTSRDDVDLRRFGGPRDATVIDVTVQELTPDGGLVWSWSTKDHISLRETAAWGFEHAMSRYQGKPAYDLTHLNSVDLRGNVLVISCKHLRALYGIRRSDGKILWKLGGTHRPESIAFKRDPYAPKLKLFGGQHAARQAADGTVYVHDNGSLLARRRPRVARYRLNLRKRTATLVESFEDKRTFYSYCCGNAQRLPRGHWLVSWGSNPIITELDRRHRPVLTLSFPRKIYSYWVQGLLPGALTIDQLRAGMDAQYPR